MTIHIKTFSVAGSFNNECLWLVNNSLWEKIMKTAIVFHLKCFAVCGIRLLCNDRFTVYHIYLVKCHGVY